MDYQTAYNAMESGCVSPHVMISNVLRHVLVGEYSLDDLNTLAAASPSNVYATFCWNFLFIPSPVPSSPKGASNLYTLDEGTVSFEAYRVYTLFEQWASSVRIPGVAFYKYLVYPGNRPHVILLLQQLCVIFTWLRHTVLRILKHLLHLMLTSCSEFATEESSMRFPRKPL